MPLYRRDLFQFTPLREGRPQPRNRQARCSVHFNSRPSARGDKNRRNVPRVRKNFNSRPSARGDPASADGRERAPYFNSRPSARGDPLLSSGRIPREIFQFTPLREGRLTKAECLDLPEKFQFTPLREGRRGLTISFSTAVEFQFTPLREGRRETTSCPTSRQHFNSRPSARGDKVTVYARHIFYISIHAPPRGATISSSSPSFVSAAFQFTPLREGRHRGSSGQNTVSYFNSRPSARGDRLRCAIGIHHSISIHAPPRGATKLPASTCAKGIFQFTPLREGRRPNERNITMNK